MRATFEGLAAQLEQAGGGSLFVVMSMSDAEGQNKSAHICFDSDATAPDESALTLRGIATTLGAMLFNAGIRADAHEVARVLLEGVVLGYQVASNTEDGSNAAAQQSGRMQ